MKSKTFKNFATHLRSIAVVDLAFQSTSYVEKLLWAIIGILSTVWLCQVIPDQIRIWEENASIITKGHIDLSDVKYPAISICPQSITKYAITEELGNYLRPDLNLPEVFATVRKDLFICATNMDEFFKKWKRNTYNDTCKSEKPELGCEVREIMKKHVNF